jgi:hypothetical protein
MAGCGEREDQGSSVNVTIRNASGRELKGIRLGWEGSFVPGGVMRSGVEKTAVGVQWPASEDATIEMIDMATGARHRVEVSLEEVGAKVRSGTCKEVVIEISSHEAVSAYCKGRAGG